MTRCDTFPRSIAFGALAAIGWGPWIMFTGPLIGVWDARALYFIAVLTLYASGLTVARANRMRLPVATGLVAAAVAMVAGSTTELAIGLALTLGIARSGFLYPAAPARALLREAVLLLGGLLLARFLTAAPASTGSALWGFVLVQSFFFLLPAARQGKASIPHLDPFEEAHRRALSILERTGV